jgi:hypothetical protein
MPFLCQKLTQFRLPHSGAVQTLIAGKADVFIRNAP